MDVKFNYDRERKIRKNSCVNGMNTDKVINDMKFESHLQNLNRARNFDKAKFDAGSDYFNMGGKLENASPELRNNTSFLDGYARAERLKMISNKKTGLSR